MFVPVIDRAPGTAAHLATELRERGIKTDLSLLEGKSLGEQLKYAGRRGIGYAAILGPNEIERNTVSVKNLNSGEQFDVEHSQLLDLLARLLQV